MEIWCSLFLSFLAAVGPRFYGLFPLRCIPKHLSYGTSFLLLHAVGCLLELQISLNMVQRTTTIIKDYQDRLCETPYIPKTSFQQDLLGFSGDMNKTFLAFLFSDHTTGLQFLKVVGLICSNV
jgi:hypothetical protein